MNKQERKAAVAAYKERKPAWGIYAVICTATGEVWVGSSNHVDTQQNGLWFGLRMGSSRHKDLQAAWKLHGEAAFRFEELDRISDDLSDLGRADDLKKRKAIWTTRLQASAV
jgi:hypothetical protein